MNGYPTNGRRRRMPDAIRRRCVLVCVVCWIGAGLAPASAMDVDALITGIETRYGGPGFFARFYQESTLKAMDIVDSAAGSVWFKQPGRMRWQYERPEPQLIVSDGTTLWIHRPEDRQVMVGDATDTFGDGKGASFLSDIRLVKTLFTIVPVEGTGPERQQVRLLPKEPSPDLASIRLTISTETFDIQEVVTTNAYGDETRIVFSEFQFGVPLDDALFDFEIPEDADVLRLE